MSSLTSTDAAVEPLWSGPDLNTEPDEFLTILGPDGVGKSMLLTAAPGIRRLTYGSVKADGNLGYTPQQRMFEPSLPIRVRDLVELAVDKSRFAIEEMLGFVGTSGVTDRHVGALSGDQQQFVHQAQAPVSAPDSLLRDRPLLLLDPAAQRTTVECLDRHHWESDTAVVSVTHDINPILGVCDRVLYPTPYGHAVRSVEETITSEMLSELYQAEIVVVRVEGKLVIAQQA